MRKHNTKPSTSRSSQKDMGGHNFNYEGYDVTIKEDDCYYYIDFHTGLGDGIYPKEDWTLAKALYDQAHIYDEKK